MHTALAQRQQCISRRSNECSPGPRVSDYNRRVGTIEGGGDGAVHGETCTHLQLRQAGILLLEAHGHRWHLFHVAIGQHLPGWEGQEGWNGLCGGRWAAQSTADVHPPGGDWFITLAECAGDTNVACCLLTAREKSAFPRMQHSPLCMHRCCACTAVLPNTVLACRPDPSQAGRTRKMNRKSSEVPRLNSSSTVCRTCRGAHCGAVVW